MQNNEFEYVVPNEDIVYDTTNVTEENPLIEIGKVLIQLVLILVSAYFAIFLISGIILKNLSLEKQIKLENSISKLNKIEKLYKCHKDKKATEIKKLILENDKTYPKTSKLEIKIMDSDILNAFCYPNGNIYITKGLYNSIKNDEELAFIIAHEMAHYKHKDHLVELRKTIASSSVVILFSIIVQDGNMGDILSSAFELSDLKHSRNAEKKADKYAGQMLVKLYGTTIGGIGVLKFLDKEMPINEAMTILSTHPSANTRIEELRKIK